MTYEIVEGVRRAKAALRCGHEIIAVQIDGDNDIIQVLSERNPLNCTRITIEENRMSDTKRVWLFEEGNATMRDELGGKGANLCEMSGGGR